MTKTKEKKENQFVELVRLLIHAGIIALVIRTFLFQPFNIPSGSMKATLLVGDYLFVSKYSYGFSRYSLPFINPASFTGRIFGSKPERGDVLVFRLPADDTTDYIKRVIGLPGDRIQVIDGQLHINGVAVSRVQVPDFVGEQPCPMTFVSRVKRWRETLPNGVSYEVLDCMDSSGFPDTTQVYTVPEGNYFMMGDNRDNSTDSRFPSVGFVPFDNLVGKAQVIFFSVREGELAREIWRWPWTVRWGRLLTIVR
ncbi:MAG TPA: signal peptidase I [Xanthobacteraceae bacterium]|nr:signal peptidase I [Xanthobacteraceae bacterium]